MAIRVIQLRGQHPLVPSCLQQCWFLRELPSEREVGAFIDLYPEGPSGVERLLAGKSQLVASLCLLCEEGQFWVESQIGSQNPVKTHHGGERTLFRILRELKRELSERFGEKVLPGKALSYERALVLKNEGKILD